MYIKTNTKMGDLNPTIPIIILNANELNVSVKKTDCPMG